jgi:hypothetical protein
MGCFSKCSLPPASPAPYPCPSWGRPTSLRQRRLDMQASPQSHSVIIEYLLDVYNPKGDTELPAHREKYDFAIDLVLSARLPQTSPLLPPPIRGSALKDWIEICYGLQAPFQMKVRLGNFGFATDGTAAHIAHSASVVAVLHVTPTRKTLLDGGRLARKMVGIAS